MKAWRSMYPKLRIIKNTYPFHIASDAYTIHLVDDGEIIVDLETQTMVDVTALSFVEPVLPVVPTYDGMTIRHHLSLGLKHNFFLDRTASEKQQRIELAKKWADYLYHNETGLDSRIIRIGQHDSYDGACDIRRRLEVPLDDTIDILQSRRSATCEPLREISIMKADEMTLARFHAIIDNLPPGLRTLQLIDKFFKPFANMQEGIALLDKAVPLLEKLKITVTPRTNPHLFAKQLPLSGMRNFASVGIYIYPT